MRRVLFLGFLLVSFGAVAADGDDGFIWIDANTRIKIKPISAGGGATAPEKAPDKAQKKEKAKK
jgi:hypothetical protein